MNYFWVLAFSSQVRPVQTTPVQFITSTAHAKAYQGRLLYQDQKHHSSSPICTLHILYSKRHNLRLDDWANNNHYFPCNEDKIANTELGSNQKFPFNPYTNRETPSHLSVIEKLLIRNATTQLISH